MTSPIHPLLALAVLVLIVLAVMLVLGGILFIAERLAQHPARTNGHLQCQHVYQIYTLHPPRARCILCDKEYEHV